MKTIISSVLFGSVLFSVSALAKEFVLTDTSGVRVENWHITNAELGVTSQAPFTIRMRSLHGGRQEGVDLIEVDNGKLSFTVVPTRGMSIYQGHSGDLRLGWDSPVKEIVNPAYIDLQARNGLGWLDGFNEFLVRCGVEWAGHAGIDDGKLLSLHGREGNTPASKVVVIVDDQPPYRIHIRGRVVEQTFHFIDYELWTEVSTEPNSSSIQINDTLSNRSDYEREFEIIYHGNFGPPLLEQGSRFVAPVRTVAPFDDYAAKDIGNWTVYRGPTKGFGEHVFVVEPFVRKDGTTTVMLENAAGDRGIRIDFDARALPCFSLWKNTDTLKEGYVTGLEPGTSFPWPRSIERSRGRVPKLDAGASRSFSLKYTILCDKDIVNATAAEIMEIQGALKTQLLPTPHDSN